MKSKFYKGFEKGTNIMLVFGVSIMLINTFWLFSLVGLLTENVMLIASPIGFCAFLKMIMEVRKK